MRVAPCVAPTGSKGDAAGGGRRCVASQRREYRQRAWHTGSAGCQKRGVAMQPVLGCSAIVLARKFKWDSMAAS